MAVHTTVDAFNLKAVGLNRVRNWDVVLYNGVCGVVVPHRNRLGYSKKFICLVDVFTNVEHPLPRSGRDRARKVRRCHIRMLKPGDAFIIPGDKTVFKLVWQSQDTYSFTAHSDTALRKRLMVDLVRWVYPIAPEWLKR